MSDHDQPEVITISSDTDSELTELISSLSRSTLSSPPTSVAADGVLDGHWGPVRLFREAKVDDPIQCINWCIEVGLLTPQPICRRHRALRTLRLRHNTYYWHCRRCDDAKAVTLGSIFQDARLPFGKILMLAYSFSKGSYYDEARCACIFDRTDQPLPDSTIARWFELFRDCIVSAARDLTSNQLIGGPGMIVQVDEALIGRRKYNRGRAMEGTWVLGMIDSNGAVHFEICPHRDRVTLHSVIQRSVRPGSDIHTDGWRAYQGLENLGYDHHVVNHRNEFVAADGTHTQRIEAQWRALRRLFTPGGRRHDQMADYLVEYMWRRKCIMDGVDPFPELLRIMKAQ